jgi:hypothetical protein
MKRLDAYSYGCSIYEEVRQLLIRAGITVNIEDFANQTSTRLDYENAISSLTPIGTKSGVLFHPLGDYSVREAKVNTMYVNYVNDYDTVVQNTFNSQFGTHQDLQFRINILAKNYKDGEYLAGLVHSLFYAHSGHRAYDLEFEKFSDDYLYTIATYSTEVTRLVKANLDHVVEYICYIKIRQAIILFQEVPEDIEYGIFKKLNALIVTKAEGFSFANGIVNYGGVSGDEIRIPSVTETTLLGILEELVAIGDTDKTLIGGVIPNAATFDNSFGILLDHDIVLSLDFKLVFTISGIGTIISHSQSNASFANDFGHYIAYNDSNGSTGIQCADEVGNVVYERVSNVTTLTIDGVIKGTGFISNVFTFDTLGGNFNGIIHSFDIYDNTGTLIHSYAINEGVGETIILDSVGGNHGIWGGNWEGIVREEKNKENIQILIDRGWSVVGF